MQRQKNKKRQHAVTKGFLRENQSQVTMKSLRRRKKRKRRKAQGLVENKELYILSYLNLQAILSLILFQTLAFISISIVLGHQQSSRNFTVEKELTAC